MDKQCNPIFGIVLILDTISIYNLLVIIAIINSNNCERIKLRETLDEGQVPLLIRNNKLALRLIVPGMVKILSGKTIRNQAPKCRKISYGETYGEGSETLRFSVLEDLTNLL